MLKLSPSAVPVVIDDTRAALKATDHALLASAQMLASVLQGAQQSDLPVGIAQDLYEAMVSHSGKIVESRNQMRRTIRLLTSIRDGSDHRSFATGCPDGFPNVLEPERDRGESLASVAA